MFARSLAQSQFKPRRNGATCHLRCCGNSRTPILHQISAFGPCKYVISEQRQHAASTHGAVPSSTVVPTTSKDTILAASWETGARLTERTLDRRSSVLLMADIACLMCSMPSPASTCQLVKANSGLEYCDLQEGTGFVPVQGAFVKCHYIARLAGTSSVFDSSYKRGKPLLFKVGEKDVIAGWDEAILGSADVPPMREGGKRQIVLPPGVLQRQGPKSLVWVVGLSEALEMEQIEFGAAADGSIAPNVGLEFVLELLLTKKTK